MNIKNDSKHKFDMKDFFTSKSNVLKILANQVKKSRIEKIFDLTVHEWRVNESKILNEICKNFDSQNIVVRSSAKGEDSWESSHAGRYKSILNVHSKSKDQIRSAINSVIESFVKAGNVSQENQVLIQKQTMDIDTSGVIFTRTESNASPYYILNFEEGSSTEGVTQGRSNNIIKIFRSIDLSKLTKKWKFLLESVKEIESLLGVDLLDIEFGITSSNQVVIFQVRPLTSIKKIEKSTFDNEVKKNISKCKMMFTELVKPKHVPGNFTIFSDMADWNPAEIIGNNPNLLDYSLYDYLVMKKTWHEGRTEIGYCDVNPYGLMVKFGNKPYVDLRGSFNSLIPEKICQKTRKKLIEFYLKKLEKNPHLHDKVEFEILFTCYDLTVDNRLKELSNYDFTENEINEIKTSLIDLTNKIITNFPKISKMSKICLEKITNNRNELFTQLELTDKNYANLLDTSEKLLNDCMRFGTKPFSIMARIAFIGSALLNSLTNQGKIDSNFLNAFMNSIQTPLSDLRDDFSAYLNKKSTKEEFLKKYGHLRPGTYDITAMRYDKENPFFENMKFLKSRKLKLEGIENKSVSEVLIKNCLNFENIDFLKFIKDSLVQREELKFYFTRNLSDAIELIAEAGNKLGFSRLEMANLDVEDLFSPHKQKNENELKEFWRNKINKQIQMKKISDHIVLPPLIFNESDFEIINYFTSKPNFITTKSVTADLVKLDRSEKNSELDDKIILIENADPGYDWIFTKNPKGLITMYGGVASHMSIRCAEIGLAAAIGCGEILFEKLLYSTKVLLDCENQQIVILEHKKIDECVEVKKILKSIGYIK